MIPIPLINVVLEPDEQVKADAATKQMHDLLGHVSKWVKYRLLSTKDRQNLIKSGYARDLVDNLVYCTRRSLVPGENDSYNHHVYSFTELAFDPSIYACETISQALIKSNHGRCAWCESLIEQNDGIVSHYRPTYGYTDKGVLHRPGYYELAYKQDNLLYTCRVCAEHYKKDQFPFFHSGRASGTKLENEKPVLISPYTDDPRCYIRFNPLNGHAYAYDIVVQFYQDTMKTGQSEIDELIWNDPANIPGQFDSKHVSISSPDVNGSYKDWIEKRKADNSCLPIRGQTTIDILGLNRQELVRSRVAHLSNIRGLYLLQANSNNADEEAKTAETLLTAFENHQKDTNDMVTQYISLTADAFKTWQAELIPSKNKQQDDTDSQKAPPSDEDKTLTRRNWIALYNDILSSVTYSKRADIPPFLRSVLMYIVLENELSLKNKRRIISLSSTDLLYASVTSKCILLEIDWDTDFTNTIKVHSNNLTWETSFKELAETHPVALLSLFENNEIWAEGKYEALSDM